MTRIVIPTLLLAAALGLFVLYINPMYNNIQALATEKASYDDALDKSAQLRTLRDQLLSTRASFPQSDVEKLSRVLPDNVDNIRLIIDINNVAARHKLSLTNVQLGDVSQDAGPASRASAGPTDSAIGSVQVGFSVAATYDDFLSFLQDLEHSLRIVDVDKIAFVAGQGDLNIYTMQIRTYWLH